MIITAALFFGIANAMQAQQVTESVANLHRRYTPLFGTTASTITIDFLKNYELGSRDTSYLLAMSVNNTSTELQGYSVGASVFGLYSGVSVANQYALKKTDGRVSLDRENFLLLYDCVSKVFKFAAGRARNGEAGNNMLCTCGVDGITFGGEQAGGSRPATFYFRVGENSMFSMTQAEFTEIMSVMNTAKRQWTPMP